MIEIEIDGKKLEVAQGSMIIEVADDNNIEVPRFCYHERLSVAANCRMCLVEVEKIPKPVPACATPVTPGMKIFTKSAKIKDAQRAIMEFLLINHPLDCPICDQGGECELQDNAMAYGNVNSPYSDTKRSVEDKNIGPLIQTCLTRCIQCTRCVRFGQEIAGLRELGMINRGEDSEIATFLEKSLVSEVSANVIDLCPVGALVSKPFLYTARAWELRQHAGIAMHDALGSNIYLQTRRNEVMRVVPKENEQINEVWLSDRDRFSYLGISSSDRLLSPMIKQNNQWNAVDWETALHFAASGITRVQQNAGKESLLGIASPSSTQEEYYLLQQLWKALGATDLTYLLRTTDTRDFEDASHAYFGLTLEEVEQQKSLLMIGSHIQQELPLLALRFRKATLNGAMIELINAADYDYPFKTNTTLIQAPIEWPKTLAGIIKAAVDIAQDLTTELKTLGELDFIKNASVTEAQQKIAAQLMQTTPSFIYLGAVAYHHPHAALLRQLTQALALLTNSQWGMHTDGCNTHGLAALETYAPAPLEALTSFTVQQKHQAVLLHNIDPLMDAANPFAFSQLLNQAEFVVALTPFKTDSLLEKAHVLLPIGTQGETSGSFTNLLNQTQRFTGCITPPGEARPAWKVIRVLANAFHLPNFTYTSSNDIFEELSTQPLSVKTLDSAPKIIARIKSLTTTDTPTMPALMRITQWPLYRVDNLVRRAEALQVCGSATHLGVYMNHTTLQQLNFQEGQSVNVQQGGSATLSIIIDNRLPDKIIYIPAGFSETSLLGESFGAITLSALG